MRFYVMCPVHYGERVYVRFENEAQIRTKADLPFTFQVVCPSGVTTIYSRSQVTAEAGFPIGVFIGAALFLVDPLLGLLGVLGGGILGNEDTAVNTFNSSFG
jgi:hypothetical protein